MGVSEGVGYTYTYNFAVREETPETKKAAKVAKEGGDFGEAVLYSVAHILFVAKPCNSVGTPWRTVYSKAVVILIAPEGSAANVHHWIDTSEKGWEIELRKLLQEVRKKRDREIMKQLRSCHQ